MIGTASQTTPGLRSVRRSRSWRSLIRTGVGEMLGRWPLILRLVSADLKRTHTDTLIGQLWWILDPLLQMAVYWLLVGVIFQRSTPDFALFLFAAILPWKWFSTTMNDATISITIRENLIRQLAFPKIVLPTASVVTGLMDFGFGLIALGAVYLFFLDRLSAWVLVIPLIAVVQFLFTLSLAIVASAANAFYRDVQNILRHIVRLWFYASPGVYSLETIDKTGQYHFWLSLNPFSVILDSYRAVTWGTTAPNWTGLAVLTVVSLVLLAIAVVIFKRVEPSFAKIL
jgi:lipopolysaccharide transport system permease protein/teichoic acid transport system permease protein